MAADWAGFESVGFAEVAEYQSSELARLWPEIKNYGDVTKICTGSTEDGCYPADEIREEHGDITLLTAGVPCQPASHAGDQRGSDDPRWLWPHALRILRELRPPFAIFENPVGIRTVEEGEGFLGIQTQLALLGYDCWWETIPATAIGAGHVRKRVWITAYSRSAGLERWSELRVPEEGWTDARRPSTDEIIPSRKTSNGETWYRESPVPVVVDGVSSSALVNEFTAVGNAIVPQVAYCLLQPIADFVRYQQ
jgi:DNA (cytosine-5)-methyltransferase 1